jgi:hypothetical protein
MAQGGQTGDDYRQKRAELTSTAKRSIQKISKDWGDSRSVQADWESILAEMGNNGIESPKMVQSLKELIIAPLDRINNTGFAAADRALVRFRDQMESDGDPREQIAASSDELIALRDDLLIVLKEMEELASYQELLGNLQQMIEATEAARNKTEKESLKDLGLDGLLD